MIPVASNDVAFSIHAVLLTAITLFQIAIYEVNMIFLLVLNIALVFIVCYMTEFSILLKLVTIHCSVEAKNCPKFRLELSPLFGWLPQFVSLLLCLIIHGFGFSASSSMFSLLLWSIKSILCFWTFNLCPASNILGNFVNAF
jgi:hypothetical protein